MRAYITALTTHYTGNQFINLMDQIEQRLLTIEPQSYRQHDALAVLMGRPLALVRASLKLELKGDPAINQDRSHLKLRTTRTSYAAQLRHDTAGFTNARSPSGWATWRCWATGWWGFIRRRVWQAHGMARAILRRKQRATLFYTSTVIPAPPPELSP
ncbi:hypothetical protein [Candidatus Entotheonella palauensis]|uniref:hypothetical protein n=1 Tax=Candidatus Entotheonella palauensis TaxID=93172 RepID=UPI000B7DB197|nr:hypothetical protein [Candidatus Entotheonella palauensis]